MKKLLNSLYSKLFRINDSPQRIALGLGLGVFSGIIPGTGPIAALFLAFIFRVNRASALLGSLLTNTWLSFFTFILAIKTGAFLFGISRQDIHKDWLNVLAKFSWLGLLKAPVLKILLPVITGYIIIAFLLGVSVYLVSLPVILKMKHTK